LMTIGDGAFRLARRADATIVAPGFTKGASDSPMKIGLYAAVAENGVIGREGGLPWRLSTDLKRFKANTMGKPVIMGRKTWESIGRALPGRLNIVVTRKREFAPEGALVASSLESALDLARRPVEGMQAPEEAAVIGGGEIYRQAMAIADILHITHVEAQIEGDTFFPPIEPGTWRAVSSQSIPPGDKDSHPTRHVVYERI
jgi:dihydrofolate reductase